MEAPELKAVLLALGSPDTDVRFVGGCVRDTVLGRKVTDVDLATPDPPQSVMEKVKAAGLDVVPTGLDHGTVTVVSSGRGFEVTTLRRDTSCDGRHADVEFTTDWMEDASRRDFTFNAMSARPDGMLFDPFGGVDDAQAGRVRFVGNPRDRIKEDYLRILRYFRFLAHFGAEPPDQDILAACRELRSGLGVLSQERIRDELIKILRAPDPTVAWDAMTQTGVTADVLPEVTEAASLTGLMEREAQVDAPTTIDVWQRRLIFLLSNSLKETGEVARRLRLSNKNAKAIAQIFAAATNAAPVPDEHDQQKFLYNHQQTRTDDAILIAWAWQGAAASRKWPAFYKDAQAWSPMRFPLSGADAEALGVPQGPAIGDLLKRLEDEWIDSGFTLSEKDLRRRLKSLALS